ncbi:MAG: AAA family ATPase [Pirellulaceae bacterium]
MITGIYIENFKGIGDPGIKLDLAPLTLMFGKNSAGKSTIFHAFLYAYEVLVNRNLNADRTALGGNSVDLGGYYSFVHGHALKSRITIRIELDLSSAKLDESWRLPEFLVGTGENAVDLSALGTDVWSGSVSFTVAWAEKQNRPFVNNYAVRVDDQPLANIWCESPGSKVLSRVNYRHPIFHWPNAAGPPVQTSAGVLDELYPPIQSITDQWFWKEGVEFNSDDFDEEVALEIGNVQLLEAPDRQNLRMIEDVSDIGTVRWFYRYDIERQKATLEAALFYAGPEWNKEAAELEWAKLNDMNDNDMFVGIEILEQEDALPPLDRSLQLLLALDAKAKEDAPEDEIASLLPSSLPTEIREQIEERFAKLSSGVAQETRDVIRDLVSRLALGPLQVLVNELEDFRHIGPLRDIPPRSFRHTFSPDASRWSSGLAAWDVLSTASDEFVEQVSDWLSDSDHLNTGYTLIRKKFKELETDGWIMRVLEQTNPLDDLPLAMEELAKLPELTRVTLRTDQSPPVEVDPPDIAVGITQLVPIVVAALDQHDGISLIEQPELHNHPAVEVALGDLFIESVGNEHQPCRFLIETHGEHFLLRILRRIRETTAGQVEQPREFKANRVAIYVFGRDDGTATVRRVEVDVEGEFIQPWPDDFFEIDFNERFD